METEILQCPKCLGPLPESIGAQPGPCPRCDTLVEAHRFPTLGRPLVGMSPAEAVVGEESNCFYHSANRAAVVCDVCGRFLCGLCDIVLGSRHLCPACLNSGQQTGRVANLVPSRALWGRIALLTAVGSLVIYPLLIFGAPGSVFLGIYGWRQPGSLVRRRKVSHLLAILIGLAEIGLLVALVVVIIRAIQRGN